MLAISPHGQGTFIVSGTNHRFLNLLFDKIMSISIETALHSKRVSAHAVRLGREMKLTEAEIQTIAIGAILHDIGKLSIPPEILHKPEKLTEEEFNVMKTHPAHGVSLGFVHGLHEKVTDIIHYHHERWDGEGYPQKLKSHQIPLFARITSLCDVYDTVISKRCYQPARRINTAIKEIEDCAGTQFDPEISSIFLGTLYNRYRNHTKK